MKKLILLFIIATLISCSKNNRLEKVEFLFTPSFLHPTKFTIDIENNTIEQYNYQNYYNTQKQLSETLYRTIRNDTLIVHHRKVIPIKEETMKKFLNKVKLSNLDSTLIHQEMILDGIGFRISKIYHKNDTVSLTSNISSRNEKSKTEYKLLDAFFELVNETITDYKGISGIESIQNYLSYGLQIKKISKNPIEYRIWGSLTGCRDDNQELLTFLKNLPNEKPIIFDLRNGSSSYCLNEVWEDYGKVKQIYFYGDKNAIHSKEIMDQIKLAEKNGEVLPELRKSAFETHKMIYQNVKSFSTKDEVLKTIANKVYK